MDEYAATAGPSADLFWQASLDWWQCQPLRKACLQLQDQHGLDVNELLLCVYAGLNGLDITLLWSAATLPGSMQREVIVPLRQARRAAAELPGKSRRLYRQLKALELQFEREHQRSIWHAAVPHAKASAPGAELAAENLAGLLRVRLTPGQAAEARLALAALRDSLAGLTG